MKNEEIKFRCWDKQYKEFVKNLSALYITLDDNGDLFISNPKRYILMQYTNIKNRNLCQHDIIEFPIEHLITGKDEIYRGVIEKNEYGFTVEVDKQGIHFPLENLDEVMDDVKIIGNIYKNFELLQ